MAGRTAARPVIFWCKSTLRLFVAYAYFLFFLPCFLFLPPSLSVLWWINLGVRRLSSLLPFSRTVSLHCAVFKQFPASRRDNAALAAAARAAEEQARRGSQSTILIPPITSSTLTAATTVSGRPRLGERRGRFLHQAVCTTTPTARVTGAATLGRSDLIAKPIRRDWSRNWSRDMHIPMMEKRMIPKSESYQKYTNNFSGAAATAAEGDHGGGRRDMKLCFGRCSQAPG